MPVQAMRVVAFGGLVVGVRCSIRPTELPDPNMVNNTTINPILTLSPASAGLPFPGSQDAHVPVLDPKVVVGTS